MSESIEEFFELRPGRYFPMVGIRSHGRFLRVGFVHHRDGSISDAIWLGDTRGLSARAYREVRVWRDLNADAIRALQPPAS